jgi:hypothetical protein
MRQLVVSEWVTLDGVFDADTMKQWFEPYDSVDRQQCITEMVLAAGAFLFGRVTCNIALRALSSHQVDRARPFRHHLSICVRKADGVLANN